MFNTIKLMAMISLLLFATDCNSQNDNPKLINRSPARAGQFYPNNPQTLKDELQNLFLKAKPKKTDNTIAIISPHAGYVFSGEVAASAFNQIDTNKTYKNIFIIGSSHVANFGSASIYNIGNYSMPMGEVKVNVELASKLIHENDCFTYNENADANEHSLEVQLPFLQFLLKNDFQIVPIIIGTDSEKVIQKIADALEPFFNSDNLFVISTDFSHYPKYQDATNADRNIAQAIISNSATNFKNAIDKNNQSGYKNLQTSICGASAVLTLLYITQKKENLTFHEIQYQNSGDSKYGDHDRVVGYYAISVSGKTDNSFSLNDTEKKQLLNIARKTIHENTINEKLYTIDTTKISSKLSVKCGVFVTLHKSGKLRGCIGRFEPSESLYKTVQNMAISASTQDPRFTKVKENELKEIDIEISVLTPLRKIKSIDEFILGKHGIYIKKGYASGTFLPQVAEQTNWNKEEFFGHCSRDKAGIGWDGWKDAELFVYEAIIFGEKDFE